MKPEADSEFVRGMGPERAPRPRPVARCCPLLSNVALLLLVTACDSVTRREHDSTRARAAAADSAQRAEAAFRAQLGTEWELSHLGSQEIPPTTARAREAPPGDPQPGARPTIRFSAETPGAGGQSFCNGYGSPFVLRGDSITLPRIESSAVGCDGPDSLDTRFFRGLREARRFELDSSRLVLMAGGEALLTFVPSDAARP